MNKLLLAGAILLLLISLASCTSLAYYSQAIGGQLKLLHQRTSIEKLLAAGRTDPALKQSLQAVLNMRRFASDSLGLPENKSYTGYAETGKEAIVWNVVAAPPYSMEAKIWCFPIAGCVPYRGYFKQARAQEFADQQAADGLDVTVSAATAYSTLGYFADPVLDTMLEYPAYQLAGLIFHELAHQKLYVKGDADFNEAFATAVEREGIRRWLLETGDADSLQQWQTQMRRNQQFNQLLGETRSQLISIYADNTDEMVKEQRKQAAFQQLRSRYHSLQAEWDGYAGYDAWINQDLNNAHFVLFATYEQGVGAFQSLLADCDGDLDRFYQSATHIAALPAEDRRGWLLQNSHTQCHNSEYQSNP